jgi:hypothetical protein
MTERDPQAILTEIERLLDERIGRPEGDDLTLVQRVADVILSFETWSDLAIRRLHEIHRLSGAECQFCSEWLDGSGN